MKIQSANAKVFSWLLSLVGLEWFRSRDVQSGAASPTKFGKNREAAPKVPCTHYEPKPRRRIANCSRPRFFELKLWVSWYIARKQLVCILPSLLRGRE